MSLSEAEIKAAIDSMVDTAEKAGICGPYELRLPLDFPLAHIAKSAIQDHNTRYAASKANR